MDIEKGTLLSLIDNSGDYEIAIALQNGPLPVKVQGNTEGTFTLQGAKYDPTVLGGGYTDFVNNFTEELRNKLGEELIDQIRNKAIEQLTNLFLDLLSQGWDKLEAAKEAIVQKGIDVLIDNSDEVAEILVNVLEGLLTN